MFESDQERSSSKNPYDNIRNPDSIFESYYSPAIFLEERRQSQNSRTTKTKKITKRKERCVHQPKNSSQLSQQFGRPRNKDVQKQHLEESRSLNDIIYHYARLLIFLRLKKGDQPSPYSLHLQNEENILLCQTQFIMSKQTFPQLIETPPTFSMHSNSLHYVFKHNRQLFKKKKYTSAELKIMFIAFLKKKKILSSSVYEYINDYWPDIMHLVTHPEGDFQIDSDFDSSEAPSFSKDRLQSMASLEKANGYGQSLMKSDSSGSVEKSKSGSSGEVSELRQLKKELQEDQTIAAYQIASYLHSCCKKFKLFIQECK